MSEETIDRIFDWCLLVLGLVSVVGTVVVMVAGIAGEL